MSANVLSHLFLPLRKMSAHCSVDCGLWTGWDSWIHVVFKNSYTLKLGKVAMPRVDMFVVGENKLVERVLVKEPDNFPKHQYLAEMLRPLIGDSLFSVNGDEWREQRTMLMGAFLG